jgi:trehalose-phosphatase
VTLTNVLAGRPPAEVPPFTYPLPSTEPVDLATMMILFGIDGTAASYDSDPHAVAIDPNVMGVLEPLAAKTAILAPVTGRTANDARRLLEPLKLPCVGQHGNEFLPRPSVEEPQPDAAINKAFLQQAAPLARFIESLRTRLTTTRGVTIQQQGALWTLHLGQALRSARVEEMNAARDAVRQVKAQAESRGFFTEVLRDCIVIAPGPLDKGLALDWLLGTPEGKSVRKVVAYEDDASGGPLFDRMVVLRDAGRLTEVIRVAVVHEGRLPRKFLGEADVIVPGIEGVASHMRRLLEAGG